MKYLYGLLTGLLFVFVVAGSAAALTILNPGFETGVDLAYWEEYSPSGGNSYRDNWHYNYPIGNMTAEEGNYFAHIRATSYIYQDVTWSAGDSISFSWSWDDRDYGYWNDYSLFGVVDMFSVTLATANPGNQSTDWATYSHTFENDGFGTLYFGSVNVNDSRFDSRLLIDNIQTTTASAAPAPVPEPATMLLLGTGLVGLAGVSRKKVLKK